MSHQVRATASARRQIEAAARWWLTNRARAPGLLVQELTAAQDLLAREPRAGVAFPTPGHPRARRLLMQKTRYHLYYTVQDEQGLVIIHALWHASRGRAPGSR